MEEYVKARGNEPVDEPVDKSVNIPQSESIDNPTAVNVSVALQEEANLPKA